MITSYRIEEIEDMEEFMDKLISGLKYYEKRDPDFKFKITKTDKHIEVKTLRLNESVN